MLYKKDIALHTERRKLPSREYIGFGFASTINFLRLLISRIPVEEISSVYLAHDMSKHGKFNVYCKSELFLYNNIEEQELFEIEKILVYC